MNKFKPTLALTSCLALALAACGDDPEVVEPAETVAPDATTTAEFDPMSRDYTLTEEAQARRDEFDADAFQDEYRGYRDDISGEMSESGSSGNMSGDSGAMTDNGSTDGDSMASSSGSMTGAGDSMATGSNGTGMPERSSMSWTYLDRNSDGQLSVAEYAIWAIPLDPTEPLPNDETAPYVTADEANKAADSFFYYDVDGDSYLSQREFTTARRGADVGTIA